MISEIKPSSAIFWVLTGALFLRLAGAGFGLPHLYHQDEPIIVNHALAYGSGDLNPHFFKVPPLLSYLLFVFYGIAYVAGALLFHWTKDDFALIFFRDPTFFYLSGRVLFGGILGTATVWVLYRLGMKLFSKKTALLAALFLATSFLHVRDSHYLYVDIPMIFCLVVSVHLLLGLEGRVQPSRFPIACLLAGTAVAFKYTAAPVFISFGIAAWLLGNAKGGPGLKKNLGLFLTSCLAGGLIFILLNPFSVLDLPFFIHEIFTQARAEGRGPFFHHWVYSIVGSEGWLKALLGAAGLLAFFFKRPGDRWLVSFPVIYYLFIAFFSQRYERYAMPLLPFLHLFGAYFLAGVAEKIPFSPKLKKVFFFFLAALVILPSFFKTLWLEGLLLREDTRTSALRWAEKNIPASSAVVIDHPFFSPRLKQVPEQLLQKKERLKTDDPHGAAREKKIDLALKAQGLAKSYKVYYLEPAGATELPFVSWSPLIGPDINEFRRAQVRYYIRYRYPWEHPFFDSGLKAGAKRVAVFSPYREVSKAYTQDRYAQVALPFEKGELFSRRVPGPYLEIYEVNP